MCGICGVVRPASSSTCIDRVTIERMRDVLTHRGPDDQGIFVDEQVGLGHRRLSIVDVARGHQPMSTDDGNVQLIYNGEVYNHPALMEALARDGVSYRTSCDTETVLHLYEREGAAMPRRLRGMFAIAIWNRRDRTLFLARDRFGVKPLYYALLPDGTLLFASEIKGLFASGLIRPALNRAALPDYLANHAPSGAETLFSGVRRLPAAHTLTWRDGGITIDRYWDLEGQAGADATGDDETLIERYRERFTEAVRLRLMSDVPLGVFLSGGIDSAAITAAMTEMVRDPIKTFSVAFAEREANELDFARLVARRFATDHHEVVVSPAEFFGALPRLVWHEDEPIAHPSSIPLYFVSRLAAERVKVVLTGEGSDETLAGYNRYRVSVFNAAIGRRYERLTSRAMREVVRRGIDTLPAKTRLRRALTRTFFYLPADLDTLYFDNFAVFSRRRQQQLLSAGARDELRGIDPYAAAHAALDRSRATTLLGRLLYSDMQTYLQELLMKQDQMSMAASIESRVPFLDHPLVEFASALPDRLKLRGWTTKYVLRRAMRGILPPQILSRKKMGFPVPVGEWFRSRYRGVVDEFVCGDRALARGFFDAGAVRALARSHQTGEQEHAFRLWSLVNFEIWQRIFIDGESPSDIRVVA